MSKIEYLDRPDKVGWWFVHTSDDPVPNAEHYNKDEIANYHFSRHAKYSYIEPHPAPPQELPKDVVLRCRCIESRGGCYEVGKDYQCALFSIRPRFVIVVGELLRDIFPVEAFHDHFQLIEGDA